MAKCYLPKDVMSAIKAGQFGLVREALSDDSNLLHMSTPLGSWLHIATENFQNEIAKMLIDLGIGINVKGGPSDAMPINTAAFAGNIKLAKFFLDRSAVLDVSEPDRNPLFAAIHAGHLDMVDLLLNAGIDASIRYSGRTMKEMDAVAYAKEWGREEIVNFINRFVLEQNQAISDQKDLGSNPLLSHKEE